MTSTILFRVHLPAHTPPSIDIRAASPAEARKAALEKHPGALVGKIKKVRAA